MKSKLKKLIPEAIRAIKGANIPDGEGRVRSIYHGYVSSLGASIVQAGLLPAAIFFENSEGEEQGGKVKVCQAIRLMVDWEQNPDFSIPNPERYRLSEHILQNDLQYDTAFLKKVTEYAIALKIAFRTFEKIQDD